MLGDMSDASRLIDAAARGDPRAAAELLPVVYEELRRLAAIKLAAEPAGHTLQPTALVHEAYLRLASGESSERWNGRAHFFGAAAEAMRRILVDAARSKRAVKRGGQGRRIPLEAADVGVPSAVDELLDVDAALTRLTVDDPQAARLIELRYFAGLSVEDAAELVGVARSTAYEHWAYARVRLKALLDRP
jgi:RNA polymerase sigma factor (TIGR02999 family)